MSPVHRPYAPLALLLLAVALLGPAARAQEDRKVSPITGRVVDASGRPIPNAIVIAKPIRRSPSASVVDAGSDAEGRFALEGLEREAYEISASAHAYVPVDAARVTARPGDAVTLVLEAGGVITGRVLLENGDPAVEARVLAVRVKDEEGRPVPGTILNVRAWTDDRGIYRIFGMHSGRYVIAAADSATALLERPPAATYHPSGGRASAVEVSVRTGQEVGGVDIQLRPETGFAIKGTVAGVTGGEGDRAISWVSLVLPGTNEIVQMVPLRDLGTPATFVIDGVAAGEYELSAWSGTNGRLVASSTPVRVAVRGADPPAVALALAPLASLTGGIELEPDAAERCRAPQRPLEEIVLTVKPEPERPFLGRGPWAAPDMKIAPSGTGAFEGGGYDPGRYRLLVDLPTEDWYVRAIRAPVGGRTANVAEGVTLAAGQRLSGLVVSLGRGAASVRGRIAAGEGRQLPSDLLVHAVPTDPALAEDVLRYAEARVDAEGRFALTNLAPGAYALVVRPASSAKDGDGPRPLAWERAGRAVLRQAAETGERVDLVSCRRAVDVLLRAPEPRAE